MHVIPPGLARLLAVVFLLFSLMPGLNPDRPCGVLAQNKFNGTASPDPVKNQTTYSPRFQKYSEKTPKFDSDDQSPATMSLLGAEIQQEDGVCGPGSPCVNGACCNVEKGLCGYGPDFCGDGVCISNCDAQAQCGPFAPKGKERCPLNVCCSIWGFCGTTDDFCIKRCDESVSTCGPPPEPEGKAFALRRTIGYYESWATTRPCDKVGPSDLDVDGLTHLNFAFAFFHPTTFELVAMDQNAQSILSDFTNLKAEHPKLQTWIAIGGWSFNDPGNRPDTRKAFSDMAMSADNRAKFIASLINFMDNYGFDGADIDWEYPGAEDRSGRPEDTKNFVTLCQEMKSAFDRRYGLSVTLPASYWYLRHFDVAGMEPHVDWFNVMTYDVHGVWDSGKFDNKHTGPFARPHTNLTEIDEAMSLLWRAGVKASNVVLGLAYYGRSFTLADPSCSKPGCRFKEGGKEGACSKAPGVLTMAEIYHIQETKDHEEFYDTEAAVKWMTWDSDQWVSYEDEETFALKVDYASSLGLGGTMIWAVDQGIFGTSNKLSTGVIALQQAGITEEDRRDFQAQNDASDSCYVSFCGLPCEPGYAPTSTMRGQVGNLGAGSSCSGDKYHTLCCATGTHMGRCQWLGWRGEGLSCYAGSCPLSHVMITQNSNWFFDRGNDYFKEETCNGGLMSYCCLGFKPSTQAHKDVALVHPHQLELHDDPSALAKRDFRSCMKAGIITEGGLVLATASAGPLAWAFDVLAGGGIVLYCLSSESEASSKVPTGFAGYATRPGNKRPLSGPGSLPAIKRPTTGKPKQDASARTHYGRYAIAKWPPGTTTCTTTYTCEYGQGFDQVCDNQRWTIDKILGGISTFTYDQGSKSGRMKQQWSYESQRHPSWYESFNARTPLGRDRCQIDEFPMNSHHESSGGAKQGLRAVDGDENGLQGWDWNYWLLATWHPCSRLQKSPPAINWQFDMNALDPNDGRLTAQPNQVIQKYGFDSWSAKEPCYATFTPRLGADVPIPDHGFRVHSNDPLFEDYDWPTQTWNVDPREQDPRPTSVNSDRWMRRDLGGVEMMARTDLARVETTATLEITKFERRALSKETPEAKAE